MIYGVALFNVEFNEAGTPTESVLVYVHSGGGNGHGCETCAAERNRIYISQRFEKVYAFQR